MSGEQHALDGSDRLSFELHPDDHREDCDADRGEFHEEEGPAFASPVTRTDRMWIEYVGRFDKTMPCSRFLFERLASIYRCTTPHIRRHNPPLPVRRRWFIGIGGVEDPRMASFLVAYGTGEGQTHKIANRIGDVIEDRGHVVTTVNVDDVPSDLDLGNYEAIVVGASIHRGAHQATVFDFVVSNRDSLRTKPTAFFQVSLSSVSESGREAAAGYVDSFVEKTGWNPDRIGQFGGALRYSKYGFLKRLIMKQIANRSINDAPDPDEAGDVEFTDWHEVEAFAADVASFVEGRLGHTPSAGEESDANG